MNPLVDSRCPRCNGPLIEIDRFGERLVGCIESQPLDLAGQWKHLNGAARGRSLCD